MSCRVHELVTLAETRKSQEHYVRYASGHSSSVKVCLPYGDPEYSGWEREESELARRGVHDRTAPCSGTVPESVSMGLMAAPASAAAPTKAGRTLDFPFCLEVRRFANGHEDEVSTRCGVSAACTSLRSRDSNAHCVFQLDCLILKFLDTVFFSAGHKKMSR